MMRNRNMSLNQRNTINYTRGVWEQSASVCAWCFHRAAYSGATNDNDTNKMGSLLLGIVKTSELQKLTFRSVFFDE